MAGKSHIHWLAPVAMVLALVVGFLFALSHHLFYQQLEHNRAPDGNWTIAGVNVPEQQVNLVAGTAFAFLVKAFLAVAVGIAFVQVFWRDLTAATAPSNLAKIDTKFSLPGNILSMFLVTDWWRSPLLFSLGLLIWLLPIAAVITPGTLSIQATPNTTSSMTHVPYLNFTSLKFAAGMSPVADAKSLVAPSEAYNWGGPSQILKRTASAVGAQGRILRLKPPSPNSSYVQDFYGPSLRCSPMERTRVLRVQQNIANWTNGPNCFYSKIYYAWYGDLPFIQSPSNRSWEWAGSSLVDPGPDHNTKLSIAIMPAMDQYTSVGTDALVPNACQVLRPGFSYNKPQLNSTYPLGPCQDGFEEYCLTKNSSFFDCRMYNTSYAVTYNFTNGEQDITIRAPHQESDQEVKPIPWVFGYSNCVVAGRGDQSDLGHFPKDCTEPVRHTLQTLAYQGVVQAFTDPISGWIGGDSTPSGLVDNTSVLSTTLLETDELAYLSDKVLQSRSFDLQQQLPNAEWSNYAKSNALNGQAQGPLVPAIERMFHNYVVSLMSDDSLQPNISKDALQQTNVRTITYINVYAYSAVRLWLAYGLAIGFATIAVAIGLFTMLISGASYSNNFSTILRSARNAELSHQVEPNDSGQDPLPKSLAKATVVIAKDSAKSRRRFGDSETKGSSSGVDGEGSLESDRFLRTGSNSTPGDLRPMTKSPTIKTV